MQVDTAISVLKQNFNGPVSVQVECTDNRDGTGVKAEWTVTGFTRPPGKKYGGDCEQAYGATLELAVNNLLAKVSKEKGEVPADIDAQVYEAVTL